MAQGKNKITGSVQSNKSVALFERIITQSYADILSTFNGADLNDKVRRKAILKQLDDIVESTHIDLNAWAVTQIPAFYDAGAFSVAKDLIKGGQAVDLSRQFATFHAEAIASLVNQTSSDIASAMQGVRKTTTQLVDQATRDGLLEKVAVGSIKGSTRKEITKGIVSELKKNGITSLTDRGGKGWDLNRYGSMLARTKLTQAQNQGVTMRLKAEGNDLVIVSDHLGECDQCRPWENKILSVGGGSTKYDSLDKAMGAGLFHPNCKHVVSALPNNQEYLNESLVWDANQGEYVPFNGINNGIRTDNPKVGKEITIGKNSKVYRAIDSRDGHADLGTGTYFAFKKEDAERYGKNVVELTIKPGTKMLQLDGYNSIDQLADYARKADKEGFMKLLDEFGMEGAIPRSITSYAKKLGYDGIIGDDEVFGSVVFNKANLLSRVSQNVALKKQVVSAIQEVGGSASKLSPFHLSFLDKSGVTLEVAQKGARGNTLGYYANSFKSITLNKKPLLKSKTASEITFFHELGHSIDARLTPELVWESSKEVFRALPKEQLSFIVKNRVQRSVPELTEGEVVSMLAGVAVYKEIEAGRKLVYRFSANHRRYLREYKEIYADGYAQYITDAATLKKNAPDIYAYYQNIEKTYGE